jgi:hypothetical protein
MKNRIRRQMGDAGVSESIGFLLIFAMVITGIGLVTLYGYPMLLQQQTGADEQIMEKNIIVLQNDFKSIVYKTVPYKETSLKIGGGTLFVNNYPTSGPTFQILDTGIVMADNPTGDLRYDSTSTEDEISLQNGAVVKRNLAAGSGSSMLAEPRWFFDETTRTLVINVVNIGSTGPMSREGIGRVQMKLGQTDYLRKDYSPSTETITIIYTPGPGAGRDYTKAWQNYFENTMKMTCATGPLTCTKSGVQVLVVKKTEVIIASL